MTRADTSAPAPLLAPPTVVQSTPPAAGPISKRFRGGWIIESLVIGALLIVHDLYRNELMGQRLESLRRARAVEGIERSLGIHWELSIQRFFLDWPFLVGMWNVYYQWAHFLIPLVAAVYLYRKAPARYVRWRNIFLFMLFVTGPFGWWAFPITPPKYLPARDGFVDTQVKYYSIGTQQKLTYGPNGEPSPELVVALGNTYSGIPSHHVSWALWSVLALWPVVRRRWVKGLLVLHLLMTVTAITVTANHHLLDVAASCIEVTVAFCLALGLEVFVAWLRTRGSRWRATAHPRPA